MKNKFLVFILVFIINKSDLAYCKSNFEMGASTGYVPGWYFSPILKLDIFIAYKLVDFLEIEGKIGHAFNNFNLAQGGSGIRFYPIKDILNFNIAIGWAPYFYKRGEVNLKIFYIDYKLFICDNWRLLVGLNIIFNTAEADDSKKVTVEKKLEMGTPMPYVSIQYNLLSLFINCEQAQYLVTIYK